MDDANLGCVGSSAAGGADTIMPLVMSALSLLSGDNRFPHLQKPCHTVPGTNLGRIGLPAAYRRLDFIVPPSWQACLYTVLACFV